MLFTIRSRHARYLGMPSQAYQIGDYLIDREGTLTGPENADLISELAAKGFAAKLKRPKRIKPDRRNGGRALFV